MLSDVKIIHLEPTTNCNAACPQCLRTLTEFNPNELKLSDIKKLIPVDLLKQLKKIYMCGVYGDPACASETIEMYQYFKNNNPEIILGMNTNGGIRSTDWWERLAKIMTGHSDYVVFSIDGLADTNHIYRKNVRWSKVIDNATAFVNAGGNAHWDMLVFEHNKHQVQDAYLLAKQIGFKWFRTKVSRRFARFPVDGLSAPLDFIDNKVTVGNIDCSALNENSIYIDAAGKIYPCCWQAEGDYDTDIVKWFDKLKNSWTTNPDSICKKTCLKNNTGTTFTNQFTQEIEIL